MAYVNADARVIAAIIAGKSPAMDQAAQRVLAAVKAEAAKHIDTGAYISSLEVHTVPGRSGTGTLVDDRVIVATDKGAVPIEYGHLYRHPNSRRVTWVPGLHIMARGLRAV